MIPDECPDLDGQAAIQATLPKTARRQSTSVGSRRKRPILLLVSGQGWPQWAAAMTAARYLRPTMVPGSLGCTCGDEEEKRVRNDPGESAWAEQFRPRGVSGLFNQGGSPIRRPPQHSKGTSALFFSQCASSPRMSGRKCASEWTGATT